MSCRLVDIMDSVVQVIVILCFFFFFFKQKTAYEIRNCDWSSDVCSSDLKMNEGRKERKNGKRDRNKEKQKVRNKERKNMKRDRKSVV